MPPNLINPDNFPGSLIPHWLLRRTEVSSGAKLLYAHLSEHTKSPEFPKTYVAGGLDHRTIAQGIGASERSIRNWLNELESAGLIRCDPGGWGKPCLYFFLEHPWQKK
jgi:predicted Rossmann fold nucleotide-binding protein DprA/Smf involved in DNA uptake